MVSVYEITHWFEKRFRGECRAPAAWKVLRSVLLEKPDAKLEKGLRGFRAIALMSVLSYWYATKNRSRLSGRNCVSALREEEL